MAAIGRPAMVTADFIRPGATVIDVGMNRIDDRAEAERIFPAAVPAPPKSSRLSIAKAALLVGDVHPLDVAERAGAYTPVPGAWVR